MERCRAQSSWTGKAVWSNSVSVADKQKLLWLLQLPATSGPANWWLTEFEDRPYGVAPGDLYFVRSRTQGPRARGRSAAAGGGFDLSLPLGFALGGWVLVRRKVRRIVSNE